MKAAFSLCEFISNIPRVTVVDVGAMLLDNRLGCCQSLVERGMATVIGFEPDREECAKLARIVGPPHRFFPYFVGDGSERTFHETNTTMTGSLFPPNTPLLERFQNLGELVRLVRTHRVATKRLDDIVEITDADILKLDVQGAERDVLAGAERLLDSVGVVQTEVEFVELYAGQPLFAEVDQFLRRRGFVFHTFLGFAGRTLKPFVCGGDVNRPLRQMLWADAVYVKDFWAQRLSPEKLVKMALLMHDEYASYDFCHAMLAAVDERLASEVALRYAEALLGQVAPTK